MSVKPVCNIASNNGEGGVPCCAQHFQNKVELHQHHTIIYSKEKEVFIYKKLSLALKKWNDVFLFLSRSPSQTP